MSRKIFVGNLPFAYTSEDVSELFTPFGEVVSAKVIEDRMTGRSRGFGFVEMGSEEAGAEAIQKLNGANVSGRALTVREAFDKPERGERRSGFRS